jgi:hypothetical protein
MEILLERETKGISDEDTCCAMVTMVERRATVRTEVSQNRCDLFAD